MRVENRRVSTPLGAEVIVTRAPEGFDKGVMLYFRMKDFNDRRSSEVYLDSIALDEFVEALKVFQKKEGPHV